MVITCRSVRHRHWYAVCTVVLRVCSTEQSCTVPFLGTLWYGTVPVQYTYFIRVWNLLVAKYCMYRCVCKVLHTVRYLVCNIRTVCITASGTFRDFLAVLRLLDSILRAVRLDIRFQLRFFVYLGCCCSVFYSTVLYHPCIKSRGPTLGNHTFRLHKQTKSSPW